MFNFMSKKPDLIAVNWVVSNLINEEVMTDRPTGEQINIYSLKWLTNIQQVNNIFIGIIIKSWDLG